MDLTPSAYRSVDSRAHPKKNLSQPDAARFGYRVERSSPTRPTGAVRRSAGDENIGSTHIGKLTAAAVVVAGAVVWTTGASEPLLPSPIDRVVPVQAAVAPAFYFNDYADALERTHALLPSHDNDASLPPTPTKQVVSVIDDGVSGSTPDTSAIDTTFNLNHSPPQSPTAAAIAISSEGGGDTQTATASGDNTDVIDMFSPAATKQSDQMVESPLTREITVASGDTLSGILNRNGLKVDQMHELLTNNLVKEHLSNIDIGQQLHLTRTEDGDFQALTLRLGNDTRVNIERTSSGFDVAAIDLPIESRRVVSSGKINQSLFLAAEQANLKQSTIMELANIFQWELDFARDIRKGDQFSLVYDRLYREGEYIGDGDILAAEFIRGGKSYKAIRFTTSDGSTDYYSPEGQSKRRTFMRHPVDVVRITSKFNPNRLHPVLHQIRAHRGVDYGSPHGSPIYATADGKVSFSGSKNAYGKTVVLKHGDKFSTLYAHMSRISDKSVVGKRVKQGDVIGYVGKTGRVTGTHLHYEFRVNGKQIDPLKVELPAAKPLAKAYRPELKRKADEMSVLLKQAFDDMHTQIAASALPADSDTVLDSSR